MVCPATHWPWNETLRHPLDLLRPTGRDPPYPVPPAEPLSAWRFFQAMRADPMTAWSERAYREPYVFLPGGRHIPDLALVTDPALVRLIFLDRVSIYDKGDAVRRRLSAALGNALLIAPEASWRPQRRIVAPMFQSRRVETFVCDMTAVAKAVLGSFDANRNEVTGIHEAMLVYAYGVIERTAFSSDGVADPLAFSRAIASYFNTLGRIDGATLLNLPRWLPTPGRLLARAPLRLFRREIGAVIARRREQMTRLGAGAAPDDLLTRLLTTPDPQTGQRMSDELVYDNAMVFFAAGHETTANTLAWVLFLLSENPDWDQRLLSEIQTVVGDRDPSATELDQLVQTRMVVDEALRLYPAAPLIPRMPTQDDVLGPMKLRKGAIVFTSPFISQRHRAHWDKPNSFDPERFRPARREAIDRYVYFPFGAGPRVCIGTAFAIQEIMIALVVWLRRYRFVATEPDRVFPRMAITLSPAGGLPMRLVARG
jgi:cytochrome P450